MSSNILSKKYIISVVLFFYFLNTTISIGALTIKSGFIVLVLALIVIEKNIINKLLNHSKTLLFTIPFIFVFALLSYYNNHETLNFLKIFISFFLFILIAISLKKYLNEELLHKIIIYTVVINSLIILLEFFIPPFKNFIESFLVQYDDNNIDFSMSQYRLRGLALGGGASLGFFNVLALILLINRSLKFQFNNILMMIIILLSTFFISRSSLFLSVIIFGFYLLYGIFKNPIKNIFIYILLSTVFIFLYLNYLSQYLNYEWFYWVFNFFENYIEFGTFNFTNSSFEYITGTATYNINNFLLGNGYYSGPSDFIIQADNGYWRISNALGIGSLFFYLYFFINCQKIRFNHKLIKILFIIFLFAIEYKEPILIQNYVARATIFLFVVNIYYNDKVIS